MNLEEVINLKKETIIKKEDISCNLEKNNSYVFTDNKKTKLEKERDILLEFGIDVKEAKELPTGEKTDSIYVDDTYVFHALKYIYGLKDICVDKEVVNKFIYDITDTNTDILFGNNKFDQIIFSYSRVFCDVEKFVDDKQEIMSKFGMGVINTKTNDGVLFRNIKEDTKKYILENYYYPYHKKFENIVQKMLNKNESVIIVDCHSFSKDIIVFADKKKDLPDICIGINNENKLSNFIYSDNWLDFVEGDDPSYPTLFDFLVAIFNSDFEDEEEEET